MNKVTVSTDNLAEILIELATLEVENKRLEEKLKAITCAECEKDMLDCTCDAIDTQLNL